MPRKRNAPITMSTLGNKAVQKENKNFPEKEIKDMELYELNDIELKTAVSKTQRDLRRIAKYRKAIKCS